MKTTPNPTAMELSIPSELGFEIVARDAVAAFALRIGFAPERIEDLKTALCEACINAIEHGNSMMSEMRVNVTCSYDSGRLQVEISDQGLQRYTETHKPLSIQEKLAGTGSMRGMGLLLIEQLVDEAGFVFDSRKGNCFRIALYRQPSTPPQSSSVRSS